jgi:hypothetical protein
MVIALPPLCPSVAAADLGRRRLLVSRFPQRNVVVQLKELNGVPTRHSVHLIVGYAGENTIHLFHGLWPVGFLMWKVTRPDEPVHADVMAVLYADPVALEPPQAMLAQVLAGAPL